MVQIGKKFSFVAEDIMINCPTCNTLGAYVGLITVECANESCAHFSVSAPGYKPRIYSIPKTPIVGVAPKSETQYYWVPYDYKYDIELMKHLTANITDAANKLYERKLKSEAYRLSDEHKRDLRRTFNKPPIQGCSSDIYDFAYKWSVDFQPIVPMSEETALDTIKMYTYRVKPAEFIKIDFVIGPDDIVKKDDK